MACAEALRVEAYFDGEADAAGALAIESHIAACAECAAHLDALKAMRQRLRAEAPYYRAPAALRARIAAAIGAGDKLVALPPRAPPARGFWAGLASGAIAASVLAAAIFVMPSRAPDALARDVVNAHLRSLVEDHLIDIASSDHHTVKPWFEGHGDISPPVVDFSTQGYQLVGGRADFVNGLRASVVVYRHHAHVINVFAWHDTGAPVPQEAERNGYRLLCWRGRTLAFCAVSDTAPAELSGLVTLLKAQTE